MRSQDCGIRGWNQTTPSDIGDVANNVPSDLLWRFRKRISTEQANTAADDERFASEVVVKKMKSKHRSHSSLISSSIVLRPTDCQRLHLIFKFQRSSCICGSHYSLEFFVNG
jgi:hypothetical protein